MRLPLVIRPLALEDIRACRAFLAKGNVVKGESFVQAVMSACELLCEFPGAGAMFELEDADVPAVRKWAVRGYPKYLIFYRNEREVLEVVRVLHAARNVRAILRAEERE